MAKSKKMVLLIMPFLLGLGGSKGYYFKTTVNPNSSYKMIMRITMNSKVNYDGDSLFIEKLNYQGVKLPLSIETYKAIGMSAKTNSLRSDSTFVMTSSFDYDTSLTIRNGDTVNTPMKILEGLKIASVYSKDLGVKGIEVIGSNLPEEQKHLIAEMVGKMYQNIKYPDKPMKIGDSFTQTLPTQIPINTQKIIDMNIQVTYALRGVDGNKAFFDTITKMALNDSTGAVKFILNGEGSGKLIHDIQRNYPIESNSNMILDEKIVTPTLTTIITAMSKTYYKVLDKQ